MFSRIQNLHISQTSYILSGVVFGLVEFKIYISLKLMQYDIVVDERLVEFKIYISLKRSQQLVLTSLGLVEFKIYISLKHATVVCR